MRSIAGVMPQRAKLEVLNAISTAKMLSSFLFTGRPEQSLIGWIKEPLDHSSQLFKIDFMQ